MAKAGTVKGIRVKSSLRENAQRIIAFRLEELLSWRHAIADPNEVEHLHNLRIAAKRLRYALEIFGMCFPNVKPMEQRLTQLQDDVGEIHDLDVLIDILRLRLARIDSTTERLAVDVVKTAGDAAERSNKLRSILYAQARDRQRLGLIGLLGSNIAERDSRFTRFQREWGGIATDTFEGDLLAALDMWPESDVLDLNGDAGVAAVSVSGTGSPEDG